ncbi:hypothetical protein C7453_104271 [Gluconacetobacter liquefaciens]|uniref:Uncharacterized protein n=1 Tax=Gluconacetobacter liquefaciens TaxID=89584 RepID=A0A370G5J3_GLULI|nr:hypothetical protein C7453_104271 [Gluconacetobacter liquefaciens]
MVAPRSYCRQSRSKYTPARRDHALDGHYARRCLKT